MRDRDRHRFDDLEIRLEKLEGQHQRLRDFIVPAYWNALDRLEAAVPDDGLASCLACGHAGQTGAFAGRVDECVFGGGRLERLECPECGCVFGPLKYLRTPDALVSADYALLYSFYSEGDSTEEELRAFDLLKPSRDRLYLNWGSGAWSRSVEILRAQGYDVWGYEPNAQTDSPFVVRRREEVSARFDGIFSNNVIEHLFSPLAQFLDFRDLLKPDGKMVHASPCYEWSFAFTRFHVFFPLGEAPLRLAERSGFTLTDTVADGAFQARTFSM
ncbi:MAG: methyltransferase [Alphaproteobacteria bacterium PA2]|nr:MAG: methyltransferase [Alphaproteobacteria bacterium PA2]